MPPAHEAVKDRLESLRRTLADRAEMAYHLRDKEGATELSRAYAAGEAHAYAIAEEDVRTAEGASDPRHDP
jgi:hypothetical protein